MTFTTRQFFDFVILFGGTVVALTWSFGQFFLHGRRRLQYIAGAGIFCAGIWQLAGAVYFSGLSHELPVLSRVHLPFVFCIGPILYLYYNELVKAQQAFNKTLLLHFVPAGLCLVALIPLFMLEPAAKLAEKPAELHTVLLQLFNVVPKISIIIYLTAFVAKNLYLFKPETLTTNRVHALAFFVLTLIFVSIALGLIGFMTKSQALIRMSALSLPVIIIFFYLVSCAYPQIVQEFAREAMQVRYERSKIQGLNVESILDELARLMEEERLYMDEELKLPKLAEELNVTSHQLSQILNEKLGKSFHQFINEHRIVEAKRMLVDEPDRSVLSIAYAVGFNSKSSFHKAFLNSTGITPTKYRANYSVP